MSPSLPEDFGPAGFLLLNPELPAFSNVVTVEQAIDKYPEEYSNLPYKLPLPDGKTIHDMPPFSSSVYIAQHKDDIDVSALDGVIRKARRNTLTLGKDEDDEEEEQDDGQGTFVPNFFRKIKLVDANLFRIDDGLDITDDLAITPCNMLIGNEVKILKDQGRSVIYARVTDIPGDRTFAVSDDFRDDITDEDAEYVLFGIKVADPDRIAQVNYARRYLQGFSNEFPTYDVKPFNPDLYKMLYPDSRFLTGEEAFVSFQNNWTANDFRISKAKDILNAGAPLFRVDTKTAFAEQVEILSNVHWKGVLLEGVSQDADASHSEVPETTLITEYAIKKYVDHPFNTIAQFNNVKIQGELDVGGNAMVDSESARFSSDILTLSNMYAVSSRAEETVFAGLRIGIGGGGGQDDSNISPEAWDTPGPSPEFSNVTVDGSLLLGEWRVEQQKGSGSGDAHKDLHLLHQDVQDRPLLKMTSPSQYSSGLLRVDGDVRTTGVVLSLSDCSAKREITPIQGALDKVTRLGGYTYYLVPSHGCGTESECTKDAPNADVYTRASTGLLAQEVAEVFPEAVHCHDSSHNPNGRNDALLSVAYGNMTGLLVEAMKDLHKEVQELRNAVRDLQQLGKGGAAVE